MVLGDLEPGGLSRVQMPRILKSLRESHGFGGGENLKDSVKSETAPPTTESEVFQARAHGPPEGNQGTPAAPDPFSTFFEIELKPSNSGL